MGDSRFSGDCDTAGHFFPCGIVIRSACVFCRLSLVPAMLTVAMPSPSNDDIIARWKDEPCPLLPVLHAFHDRDGHISEEAMRAVSAGLDIPLAELFGTVTFYHHFARGQPGKAAPRVCTGNVCRLNGGGELLASLESEGASAMPCAGRCDDMVPVIRGDEVLVGTAKDKLRHKATPLPPENPGGIEECVFSHIRTAGRSTLAGYLATEGFAGMRRALAAPPAELVRTITDSKLAGRGGAGFPTGVKWKAVADAPGSPKWIVCNADEGEPGCFKDRALMDHDPFAMLEGMMLAGYATGAPMGVVYLRYEYPETFHILERAIAEAEKAGWLGGSIQGSGFSFRIIVRRGAGAYICGEESSLLNSLEGRHPFPRNKPPFPVTHGLCNKPTVVNNVETFAAASHIARMGAEWYRGLGLNGHAGTKLASLSGDVQWSPIYAKLSLAGAKVLHFDVYGLAGLDLSVKDSMVLPDFEIAVAPGGVLGIGGRFYLNKNAAVRVQLRDEIVAEIRTPTEAGVAVRHQVGVTAGFAMLSKEK